MVQLKLSIVFAQVFIYFCFNSCMVQLKLRKGWNPFIEADSF